MSRRGGRPAPIALLGAPLLIGALALPGAAAAQTSPCEIESVAGRWSGPLARIVRVDDSAVTLREALGRVATAARVRISYSLDTERLDRAACALPAEAQLGDLLTGLLRGVPVRPVAAADDHVVLAPAEGRPVESGRAPLATEPVVALQPILVRADPTRPATDRPDLVVDVLDASHLADSPHGALAPAMNAAAPGVWMWPSTSSGVAASFASVRGVSSFESTSPKVYIDGVQVANPLVLTRLSPESIERIEVIRGPQGAALFGADAISGVLNITTRSAPAPEGPHISVRSALGLSATARGPGTALAQDHAVSVSLGSTGFSAMFDAALGTSGEELAGSWTRHFDAGGALRFVGERSVLGATIRYQSQHAATSMGPFGSGLPGQVAGPGLSTEAITEPLAVEHYTVGLRGTLMPEGLWTHTFVIGVDGYGLDAAAGSADEALGTLLGAPAAGGTALRGTMRASSSARFGAGRILSGGFTATLEHTLLRQRDVGAKPLPLAGDLDSEDVALLGSRLTDASRNDTGAGAQLDLALAGRWFLTGGVRFEYTDAIAGLTGVATLPSVGAAWTALDGPVRVKLRSAWGKGIRWPELTAGGVDTWSMSRVVYVPLDLGPEQQTGIEAGIDVDLGDALAMRLTRFDQTASGLVQRVVLPADPRLGAGPGWAYQNVGEITNRGWEVQGTAATGPLTLVATYASVDSRVQRLASGYAGDLQSGDRMLGVPERTFGLSATWTGPGWSANVAGSRASDWVNYDRVALSEAFLNGETGREWTGPELRDYWHGYDGITHLTAWVSRDLQPGLVLMLSGENLLNHNTGEPDNAAVLRGRTLSLGVRATF